MINFFKNILKNQPAMNIENIVGRRAFIRNYFIDKKLNDRIKTNGYVVLENVVSDDALLFLKKAYEDLCVIPGYAIDKKFQNSGRFQSAEIRKFVMENIFYDFDKWNILLHFYSSFSSIMDQ